MSDPIRLTLPIVRIPPNHGGGRGVFLWGQAPKGDPRDPRGMKWVRATVFSWTLAQRGMPSTDCMLQFQIPFDDLQEAFRKPATFIELIGADPRLSPDAKLFNPDGSIIKPRDDSALEPGKVTDDKQR